MNSMRKRTLSREPLDVGAEAEGERARKGAERAHRVLLEISNDARRLKDRYLDDTVVPEGGE